MNHLTTYKLFELNHYQELSELKRNIDDICIELTDNGVEYDIQPKGEIRTKMLSLSQRGLLDKERGDDFIPFYINIDTSNIKDKVDRSGALDLPDWFGEVVRRIEDYMTSLGYELIISVRLPGRWLEMKSIDELMDCHSHTFNIRLKFKI